jgi:hypothetical protein
MIFCPECGAQLVEGAKFCMECGLKLDEIQGKTGEYPISTQKCEICGMNDAEFQCVNCEKKVCAKHFDSWDMDEPDMSVCTLCSIEHMENILPVFKRNLKSSQMSLERAEKDNNAFLHEMALNQVERHYNIIMQIEARLKYLRQKL